MSEYNSSGGYDGHVSFVPYSPGEIEAMLNDIACEVPDEFFKHLNGGVILLEESKSDHDGLCTMGEYHHDSLGRWICIYYGSFMRVYGNVSREKMREQLRETLFHEFTHHVESLAGERGLEIKDKIMMNEYLCRKKQKK